MEHENAYNAIVNTTMKAIVNATYNATDIDTSIVTWNALNKVVGT